MSAIDLKGIHALIKEAADGAVTDEDLEQIGTQFKDLGMDSLTQMQLMVLLEEKYKFEVDFEEAINDGVLDSYDNLAAFIEKYAVNIP
ncbi:acyl carrier protein [Paenibacillus xylaniclasticus]|uniref:acyl carrier protein n=1 Tax=Paenibacillus xylaniclasticus TaxID=588083 RepID=UPI000FD7ACD6|nr:MULTISPECIES: acyl carrier protein [Paenibacillus]GFN32199.1 hypothetical protein PCURB6_24590 [Paenibacillus curdlanolyticus]